MVDLNAVALIGRLVRPCEVRYSNSGNAICSFSIAVNKRQKAQDGSWVDKASFFDCTYFGKAAEGVSQYLTKGKQVSVQGSLEQQTWENNGQKRSKVVVIVNSLGLLGGESQQNNSFKANYQAKSPNYSQNQPNNENINKKPAYNEQAGPEDWEDDIPF